MPIILKRGTEANRSGLSLKVGEPVFTTDTGRLYVGAVGAQTGEEVKFNELSASFVSASRSILTEITASSILADYITVENLHVQTITASVTYYSGSTIHGSSMPNTHQFTGSILATGSATFLGGNVGIGTTSPSVRLEIISGSESGIPAEVGTGTMLRLVGADGLPTVIETIGYGGTGLGIRSRYAGGTKSSPSATADNAPFFAANGHGYDTDWVTTGAIQYRLASDGDWTTSNHGTFHAWTGTNRGSTSTREWMRLRNGNLGIGTATPTVPLQIVINSASTVSESVRIAQAGAGDATLAFQLSGLISYGIGIDNSDSDALKISNTSVNGDIGRDPLVSITSAGNVGIGAYPATAKFHISSSDSTYSTLISGDTMGVRISHNTVGTSLTGVDRTGSSAYQPLNIGGSYVGFSPSGTEKVRIDATGNVGIGTTSPDATLDVSGSSGSVRCKYITANGALAAYNSSTGGIYMGYSDGGFIRSVSDNSASAAPISLEVGNGVNAVYISAARAVRFSAYGAGTLVTDSSGNVTAASDARMKDVSGSFARGLDAIINLSPKVYHWASGSGLNTEDVNVGLIAQEVLPYIPEAVGCKDDKYTMSDRPIIAALVNAVKELKAENDSLRERIEALET